MLLVLLPLLLGYIHSSSLSLRLVPLTLSSVWYAACSSPRLGRVPMFLVLSRLLLSLSLPPLDIFLAPQRNRGVASMLYPHLGRLVDFPPCLLSILLLANLISLLFSSLSFSFFMQTFTYVLPTDTRPIGIYYCVTYPSNNCLNACDQFVN